jgi:hypothetical protein
VIHRIPKLTLSPETAFFVVLKAREFHMKVEEVDPDEGSNPTDDGNVDVLEFNPGDAVQEELVSAIDGLNEDERLDLIALIWIGRGDFTLSDWREARENARRIDPSQVATYVLGLPTVSNYLEDALAQFGFLLSGYLDHLAAELPASSVFTLG